MELLLLPDSLHNTEHSPIFHILVRINTVYPVVKPEACESLLPLPLSVKLTKFRLFLSSQDLYICTPFCFSSCCLNSIPVISCLRYPKGSCQFFCLFSELDPFLCYLQVIFINANLCIFLPLGF